MKENLAAIFVFHEFVFIVLTEKSWMNVYAPFLSFTLKTESL